MLFYAICVITRFPLIPVGLSNVTAAAEVDWIFKVLPAVGTSIIMLPVGATIVVFNILALAIVSIYKNIKNCYDIY